MNLLRKKASMTLLEILMVMAIVAFIGSFLGFKSFSLLENHRFAQGVKRLSHQVAFCKEMALTHQADICLILSQNAKEITYQIGTADGLGLFKGVDPKIEKITSMQFSLHGEAKSHLTFTFASTGLIVPSVPLVLFHPSRRALSQEIYIR